MDMYSVLWVTIQYSHFFAQIWPTENSFRLTTPLWHAPTLFCFEHSLTFWPRQYFKLILYSPCLSCRISHFSKQSWFVSLEAVFWKQDVGTEDAHCYWGTVASRPSWRTKLENICIYTSHTYIYINIKINLNLCLYVKPEPQGSVLFCFFVFQLCHRAWGNLGFLTRDQFCASCSGTIES